MAAQLVDREKSPAAATLEKELGRHVEQAITELDEADELDEGDPVELGKQIAKIARSNPSVQVFGGCCGTDMRHLKSMVSELA